MFETVAQPHFSARDFDPARKKHGITALVRLRNEEQFLEQALHSILPFCDEVILLYHQCTDRTPEIVAAFEQREPERIKAYHYLPRVYWAGTDEFKTLPTTLPHSLPYYCNFGVSRATYRVCFKWDGDQVAIPEPFGRMINRLRALTPREMEWWTSPWQWGYWWFMGVNLWQAHSELFVRERRPLHGLGQDHGLWRPTRWRLFKKNARVEYLFTRFLLHRPMGIVHYHLRGLKRDRGLDKFELEKYPNSHFHRQAKESDNPTLITFPEFQSRYPDARALPAPQTLGIFPI